MLQVFSFRFVLAILVVFAVMAQSCTIQKRRYRDGFYVERHSFTRPQNKPNPPATPSPAETSVKVLPDSVSENPVTGEAGQYAAEPARYTEPAIAETAHRPDTFIVEEAKDTTNLSPKQRARYLLKNNQDRDGLPIVPNVELANVLMLVGWGTTIVVGIGPVIALVSLILLLIANSKLRNAPEGTYSPDNYIVIRRTFWPALICFLLPVFFMAFIIILFFVL
ncbi:MAG: hypothetical protein MUC87_02425 [Bacteroidia bacterium]|jgi:hypothetical protein|nr:hypothetical protein [Bacteroidia bacterium]